MKLYEGTLIFIKSKNPPVFETPLPIRYTTVPKKGQAFLFAGVDMLHPCNLSTVQKVRRFNGMSVIETLNSVYVLLRSKVSR